MNNKYFNLYNNLIKLTRNKNLYLNLKNNDTFSDRLIILLFHFGFFLKSFKNRHDKKELQNIYDFCFRQLELSIREIGYSDVTINKKMKTYINTFYAILDNINNWSELEVLKKKQILENFLNIKINSNYLTNYFDNYLLQLSNNTLNYYTKGVINR